MYLRKSKIRNKKTSLTLTNYHWESGKRVFKTIKYYGLLENLVGDNPNVLLDINEEVKMAKELKKEGWSIENIKNELTLITREPLSDDEGISITADLESCENNENFNGNISEFNFDIDDFDL